jgi:hypothetical protein
MRRTSYAVLLAACAASAAAQSTPPHTLLFGLEGAGGQTILNSGMWLDLIDDQEVMMVTPLPGVTYSARKFHTTAALRATMGDSNGVPGLSGYANGDPAGELDAAFLPVTTTLNGPVQFSDLWVSFNDTKPAIAASGHTTIDEGDVVQFLPGGLIVKHVVRTQINALLGRPLTATVDVDAMTLDAAGNLYYSDSQNSTLLTDGGLWQFPAGTWGPNGAATPNSALVVLTEAEVSAMVATATVGSFMFANDLTGVDLDPNGGTFTATRRTSTNGVLTTVDTAQLPNLIFCVKAVPGTVFTTAGGGAVATLNGVALGGPFPIPSASALGPAVGVTVGTSVYLNDLGFVAVVPYREPPLVTDYRNQLASPLGATLSPGALVVEVGDTAPFGFVNFVMTAAFAGGAAPAGLRCPSFFVPGFDYEDVYFADPLDPLFLFTFLSPDWILQTNYQGVLSLTIPVPAGLSGVVVVIQPLEIFPGARIGQPATVQFL